MKSLYIALCGASDLNGLVEDFEEIVTTFNCQAGNYLVGTTPHGDEYDYIKASLETTRVADILVFTLVEYFGDLTWNVEFLNAVANNKPYIIIINDAIYQSFDLNRKHNNNNYEGESPLNKTYKLIGGLIDKQRPFTTYSNRNYRSVLKREISYIFFRAFELLLEKRKTQNLLRLISADDNPQGRSDLSSDDLIELKQSLYDKSQNLSIRENILKFLVNNMYLTEKDIIKIIDSGGQIIRRLMIAQLQNALDEKMDKDIVFKKIVAVLKSQEDLVAIANRAIPAMLSAEPIIAIKYLSELLPFRKINFPINILETVLKKINLFKKVTENRLAKKNLKTLLLECKNYDTNDKRLKISMKKFALS